MRPPALVAVEVATFAIIVVGRMTDTGVALTALAVDEALPLLPQLRRHTESPTDDDDSPMDTPTRLLTLTPTDTAGNDTLALTISVVTGTGTTVTVLTITVTEGTVAVEVALPRRRAP